MQTFDRSIRPSHFEQELPETEFSLIRAHVNASFITLIAAALFGLLVSLKFFSPEFLTSEAWSTWGRLRYNHTQGIFFGWLGNTFFAFFYYVVPRLTNRPVFSRRLGWIIFAVWNFAVVLPGWLLVMAGISQPLEWAEFPLIVDAFVVIALSLSVWQFVIPFFRMKAADIYVSGWYLIGGLIFTLLAYPVGNVVPQLAPGAIGAAFSGLWIHDAVGLFVTPLVLVMAYWVIPATTGRPIWSHFLSMLGFWLLFLIYPLNGTHHYVYSAIPMAAQKGAILASVYLGMDVLLVTTNLLLSLRGSSGTVARDIPLRYVWTGVVLYLVVSLQGALQALMPVNQFVHFSDWVIGHSHLAMIGFASMIAMGGVAHVWQRIPGTRLNERWMAWSYWLIVIGLAFMVIDLTIAGLVEGQLWNANAPWIESVRAARPYWLVRTYSGITMIVGFAAFWISLFTGPAAINSAAKITQQPIQDHEKEDLPEAEPVHWLSSAYAVASIGGIGFFVLSFVVLGILPGRELQHEIVRTLPHGFVKPTAAEQRGRVIYGRDGCGYCHTQQVRTVAADIARFGASTAAWESHADYPQLWGTRRVGPDLAREANVRSPDWQQAHLYNPRWIVRDSVMPSYPYFFQGDASKPTQDGLDLLAYLRSLGREAILTGTNRQVLMPVSTGMNMNQGESREQIAPLNANQAITMVGGADGRNFSVGESENHAQGAALFAENCAGCHGTGGEGDGEASKTLLPKPANLTVAHFDAARISAVLWDGVYGSSMPAWRDYSARDLSALTNYVQQLAKRDDAQPAPPDDMAHVETLFTEHCVSCHGEHGDGRGPAAAALSPAPTNFHLKQPSYERALQVLVNGIPGSAMPGWSVQMAEDDRKMLARYVRSWFQTPSAGKDSREQKINALREAGK